MEGNPKLSVKKLETRSEVIVRWLRCFPGFGYTSCVQEINVFI